MTTENAYDIIKERLQNQGTRFTDYYGSSIYRSGPKNEKFFKPVNEGNYTVEVLIIPEEAKIVSVDSDKLKELLK